MVGSDPVRDLEFSPDAHVLAVLTLFLCLGGSLFLGAGPRPTPV